MNGVAREVDALEHRRIGHEVADLLRDLVPRCRDLLAFTARERVRVEPDDPLDQRRARSGHPDHEHGSLGCIARVTYRGRGFFRPCACALLESLELRLYLKRCTTEGVRTRVRRERFVVPLRRIEEPTKHGRRVPDEVRLNALVRRDLGRDLDRCLDALEAVRDHREREHDVHVRVAGIHERFQQVVRLAGLAAETPQVRE